MGLSPSSIKHSLNQNSKMRQDLEGKSLEDSSFHGFFDNPISDDLLIEILSFVPESDLLLNCRLICPRWKELIDEQSVWRRKCERENIRLPNISRMLAIVPRHHYRYIYQYSRSKKNFLKNPCGEEDLSGWEILKSFGDGLIVEKPAQGCDPVPSEVGSESCFATSYDHCAKFQLIDFYKEDYTKHLLLNELVTIKIGEWYSARFDCGSWYELKVMLMSEQECIDSFKCRYECEQWNGGRWFFIDHEFKNVSKVRYVHFEHIGCDTQFWAGHFGTKFTGGFVKLCLI